MQSYNERKEELKKIASRLQKMISKDSVSKFRLTRNNIETMAKMLGASYEILMKTYFPSYKSDQPWLPRKSGSSRVEKMDADEKLTLCCVKSAIKSFKSPGLDEIGVKVVTPDKRVLLTLHSDFMEENKNGFSSKGS